MYGVPDTTHYQRSFVLFSGGLDSTTALAIAHDYHYKHGGSVEAISIDYGQRHLKETEQAAKICAEYKVAHTVLKLEIAPQGTMLTDKSVEVPDIAYSDIKGISPTYVPFRNGMMLARIAAHAQEYANVIAKDINNGNPLPDLCTIWAGMHAEDAKNWAYPDCTPEFLGAMANAIYVGTYHSVRLSVPFLALSKDQIVTWGSKLEAKYGLSWSCYKGEDLHCGTCPTCRSRKEAFEIAGVDDPTPYAA